MNRIFDLIQVLNNMNQIPRTGAVLAAGVSTNDVENLAEHSYKVSYLCLLFGSRTEGVSIEKLLKHAITHEWGESVLGDNPTISKSYRSYFDFNIRDIFKAAEGKAKGNMLSDARLDLENLNDTEIQIFRFCDTLALILEMVDLKQRGYKHSWIEKMYKYSIKGLSAYDFPFIKEVLVVIDEIWKKGYMENKYITRATAKELMEIDAE